MSWKKTADVALKEYNHYNIADIKRMWRTPGPYYVSKMEKKMVKKLKVNMWELWEENRMIEELEHEKAKKRWGSPQWTYQKWCTQ